MSQAGVGDFSQEAGHLIIQTRVHTSVYRDLIFASGTTFASEKMRIFGEGNVVIGGTTANLPNSTFLVNGSIGLTNGFKFTQSHAVGTAGAITGYLKMVLGGTSIRLAYYTP